jgi:hypothetical protein
LPKKSRVHWPTCLHAHFTVLNCDNPPRKIP